MLTLSSSSQGDPLSIFFGSRPFLLPHPPNYHLYARLQGWKGVHQKLYQVHLQSPRLEPPILLAPLSCPQDEIDLSRPEVINGIRLFLLSESLPHGENGEGVAQLAGGLLGLENQARKRQFTLAEDCLPLSCGPRFGIELIGARSQV